MVLQNCDSWQSRVTAVTIVSAVTFSLAKRRELGDIQGS